jgi:uncharacterized protein (DUF362 family)
MTPLPQHVFVLKTGRNSYGSLLGQDRFPEGEALNELVRLSHSRGSDPFTATIKPGDHVVIKPNLVRNWHPDGRDLYSVITHPTVIRATVDQVYRALRGEGRITIADAPMGDADFDALLDVTGLPQIADYYRHKYGFEIEIRDLRKFRYRIQTNAGGYKHEVASLLPGDPDGYCLVDLGPESAYHGLAGIDLLEGTDVARRRETIASHSNNVNQYLISRTILNADVLVSVPKLKTHSKVGITINCKGMVGINGDKNYLPHFRWGSTHAGGDQHPAGEFDRVAEGRMRLGRLVGDTLLSRRGRGARAALWTVRSVTGFAAKKLNFVPLDPQLVNGDWLGNDTCWRMASDLVRIALFADRQGRMATTPQRRFLSVVDGIVAGERAGPLRPFPKPCGVLILGTHPVAVDLACARLMDFDYERIGYLRDLCTGRSSTFSSGLGPIDPSDVEIVSHPGDWSGRVSDWSQQMLAFVPSDRWSGYLERVPDAA